MHMRCTLHKHTPTNQMIHASRRFTAWAGPLRTGQGRPGVRPRAGATRSRSGLVPAPHTQALPALPRRVAQPLRGRRHVLALKVCRAEGGCWFKVEDDVLRIKSYSTACWRSAAGLGAHVSWILRVSVSANTSQKSASRRFHGHTARHTVRRPEMTQTTARTKGAHLWTAARCTCQG